MAELSPMMRQYLEIKEKNKDSILFFRVGDFYEMFFDDAKCASEELEIALTGKDCGLESRAPMCGVPYHSCEAYIGRLIAKGYKVAICEQTEDPATAKGIVKRDIVRVITPGTVLEDSMLDESKNNYLAAICERDGVWGVGFVDASTGDMRVTSFGGKNYLDNILGELGRFSPSEIIIPELILDADTRELIKLRIGCCFTILTDYDFSPVAADERIRIQFGVKSSDEVGLALGSAQHSCVGAMINYLCDTQKTGLDRISTVNIYEDSEYMRLDMTAMRNLELCESARSKEKKGTLLWVLDKTRTAMGKRLMRRWLEQPLMNLSTITSRHNAVDELVSASVMRSELREAITGINDIERLMTRIVYGTASARDLNNLRFSAERLPLVKQLISSASSGMLKNCFAELDTLEDLSELIKLIIKEDAPFSVREGGMINEGYNEELDILRTDMTGGTAIISSIENAERERTGIKTLKVRYNKVFGYYIEVTNSFLDKVPEDYIRKQTLTGCERFITDELKNVEARVLGAKERSAQLEFQIFDDLRKHIASNLSRIQTTADSIATLDVLCSLSEVAAVNNYCRPQMNATGKISITAGRHPVVEAIMSTPFVPNDTLLDNGENRCAIITGPNMAGKSTFMRQVALIVIMAQMGSFVPAEMADLCICDAVFTRVGASDDLTTGQSTFMVEMNEVAGIIKNATKNSLIILDEIGRGTSTYDGMSIARAVVEYVADKKKLGAKTVFATHYHELTSLEGIVSGIKNYNIAVRKRGDDITFLRRIVRGGADESYGIEVAKLSGIPETVISRAKQVLAQLESDKQEIVMQPIAEQTQLPLETSGALELLNELKIIDVNTLTPVEALTTLYSLADKAKKL